MTTAQATPYTQTAPPVIIRSAQNGERIYADDIVCMDFEVGYISAVLDNDCGEICLFLYLDGSEVDKDGTIIGEGEIWVFNKVKADFAAALQSGETEIDLMEIEDKARHAWEDI